MCAAHTKQHNKQHIQLISGLGADCILMSIDTPDIGCPSRPQVVRYVTCVLESKLLPRDLVHDPLAVVVA